MNFNLQNKECLVTFAVALIVVMLLAWFMYPSVESSVMQENTMDMEEGFNPEYEQFIEGLAEGEAEMEDMPEGVPEAEGNEKKPFVDPATGAVMDGPGFEKCDVEGMPEVTSSAIPSNYYFLDDGADGEQSIQHNLCSKSCCSPQWPTPFKQKYDPYVCANKDKFVPSNIFCNNSYQDSGCLCLSKKQHQFLYNRGTNGRTWF